MSNKNDKWGVIYNAKAGTHKAAHKRWEEIKNYLEVKNIPYDYVQSDGFGSVERLARLLANNNYKTIVVVGGDGALNDAINGIMTSEVEDKRSIRLGIIPNGIGNDFARYWEIPSDCCQAVDVIIGGRTRRIDVGHCNYQEGEQKNTRYFVNAINIGLGAKLIQVVEETKRFWGVPRISTFAALISTLFKRKLYKSHLIINGETIKGKLMTICIGSCTGYGQTPSAVPYNGWLDVSVIYRPEMHQLLSGLLMLIQGRILNNKVVVPFRTQKVKVIEAKNAVVALDGRLIKNCFPLEVGIRKEAVTLIIPN